MMERLQEKMRSAEKVCVGKKKSTWGPAAGFLEKNTRETKISNQGGRRRPVVFLSGKKELVLGFCVFFEFQNLAPPPPFCKCWKPVFKGKNVAKFFNLVPQLLSFCKLIFLIFLYFFKK